MEVEKKMEYYIKIIGLVITEIYNKHKKKNINNFRYKNIL